MNKNKFRLIISLIFLLVNSTVSVQTQIQSSSEQENVRKKNRAEGSVTVKILIDESGKVVFAQAISGHPLLRETAENAALKARFKPTILGGVAVKVTGNITYNFIADITWLQIGVELASAEKNAQIPNSFRGASIEAKLPKDWRSERDLARELIKIQMKIFDEEIKQSKNAEKKKSKADNISAKLDDQTKHKILIENLLNSLKKRLADSTLELWYLNLGLSLGEYNPADYNLRKYILGLSKFRQNAPKDVAEIVLSNLSQLSNIAEKLEFSVEDKATITNLIAEMLNIEVDASGKVNSVIIEQN